MLNLAKKRICVTGGSGFLGGYLVEALRARGCSEIFVPRKRDFDLTQLAEVEHLFEAARPQLIFHLAATVGGIGANRENPGLFFYDNAVMGIHLTEQARKRGIEKMVVTGTVCSYPKFTPVPFREEALWEGYPEETNAPYGLAKKMLLAQCQAYRSQYGLNSIYLMPANLYGPRDHFDLQSSHVIPALIRKFLEANETGSRQVTCWGDGSPTREFLYAADAAEGLVLAAERYDGANPVNLGSGREISIRELATLISGLCGYSGEILWDTSQPNGQPRRFLDTSRAEQLFGFRATTSLEDGLRRTVDWYKAVQAGGASPGLTTAQSHQS